MSGTQPDPNPFSREGAEPGEGLGSGTNRFNTWADGATPLGQPAPNSSAVEPPGSPTDPSSPAQPPPYANPGSAGSAGRPPSQSADFDASPGSSGSSSFPIYSYGAASSSGYADPEPNDEAYAAFRGYQAGTHGYPGQGMQPPYSSHPYGGGYASYRPRTANSPYAGPSLALGIFSVFCAVTGPVGLGLGIAALKQIDAEPQRFAGRGLAIAGIATSAIGTLWLVLFLLAAVAG